MSEMIKRLIDQRAGVWEAMKATLDKAEAEKRELTPEENTALAQQEADIRARDERIQSLTEAEQREADIAESFRSIKERDEKRGLREDGGKPGTDLASQFRAMLNGEKRGGVEVKPSSPEVRTIRNGFPVESRALSKLTAGAGGNLVYPTFYDRLFEYLVETSTILDLCQVMRTATGEPIVMPKVSSIGSAALVAELGTIPQNDPAFSQATISAYKYGRLLQISHELINDEGFDIEGFIARDSGRALGLAFGAHLMSGTGTNQPQGLLTAVTTGKTGSASVGGAFTVDDLIDLKYSVISPYRGRPGVGWLMKDATVGALRKLKNAQGTYLWEPGLQVGEPSRFDGDPVYTEIGMPAVALSAKSVLYGDFGAYVARLVEGIRFEASSDFAFNTDAMTYRALLRGDGMLLDTTGAIKAFVGNAA